MVSYPKNKEGKEERRKERREDEERKLSACQPH